ncbi:MULTISPECIES: sporulation transcriptional regulator SpoIIID [Paenisporosarcina]|uniref:Sporulation transcriptional regulator SpoIIID n=1 Tax=Paenisporosarcina quisquiliarum TaxID=365346 RepID=A0A9X3LHQ6_9BACL|nr:sporulation transcriptional regulator SpoIIID [Paenisporosarcina quisquiliarum]MCZ8537216.1 sporulation transcriptional regulator SpoIIID [Paenisporosarcina quisquiliarum]
MHEQIRKRCLELGVMVQETGLTVRAVAKKTGYSKSTVHKDLTERLKLVNEALAREVSEILAYHKSIRHIRGGEATKQMWKLKEEHTEETS